LPEKLFNISTYPLPI